MSARLILFKGSYLSIAGLISLGNFSKLALSNDVQELLPGQLKKERKLESGTLSDIDLSPRSSFGGDDPYKQEMVEQIEGWFAQDLGLEELNAIFDLSQAVASCPSVSELESAVKSERNRQEKLEPLMDEIQSRVDARKATLTRGFNARKGYEKLIQEFKKELTKLASLVELEGIGDLPVKRTADMILVTQSFVGNPFMVVESWEMPALKIGGSLSSLMADVLGRIDDSHIVDSAERKLVPVFEEYTSFRGEKPKIIGPGTLISRTSGSGTRNRRTENEIVASMVRETYESERTPKQFFRHVIAEINRVIREAKPKSSGIHEIMGKLSAYAQSLNHYLDLMYAHDEILVEYRRAERRRKKISSVFWESKRAVERYQEHCIAKYKAVSEEISETSTPSLAELEDWRTHLGGVSLFAK